MKYYSEYLKKFFDTEDECQDAEDKAFEEEHAAEQQTKKLAEERKARAKEVEDAMNEAIKANKKYYETLRAFCKDYGSFHMTYSTSEDPNSIGKMLNSIFDLL